MVEGREEEIFCLKWREGMCDFDRGRCTLMFAQSRGAKRLAKIRIPITLAKLEESIACHFSLNHSHTHTHALSSVILSPQSAHIPRAHAAHHAADDCPPPRPSCYSLGSSKLVGGGGGGLGLASQVKISVPHMFLCHVLHHCALLPFVARLPLSSPA